MNTVDYTQFHCEIFTRCDITNINVCLNVIAG